jgi:hypothetical protein
MKNELILAGAVFVIALELGLAWREHGLGAEAARAGEVLIRTSGAERHQREQLEARLAAATRDMAARQAELERLKRDVRAEGQAGAKVGASAATDSAGAKVASSGSTGNAAPKQADVWEQSIRRDPLLQALQLARDRARLAIDFEAFFRARGLTAEQVARFQDITLRRDEALADIAATIQSQGLAEDDPSIDRLQGMVYMTYKKEQIALLGTDGFQQLREFEPTVSSRNAVRGLAAAALDAGVPFSSRQAEELARAVIASRSQQPGATWRKPDWNAVDMAARGFLTAEQIALIQRVETNVHGAGGRFWSELTYLLEVTRQKEFDAGR